MKYGILSCIHSNLPALESVERDMQDAGVEKVYCLGDIVGYGPEPAECVRLVRDRGWPTVLGNHEYAMLHPDYADKFNPIAKLALFFSMGALRESERAWLQGLPREIVEDGLHLVHASPADPEKCFEYILTEEAFDNAAAAAAQPLVFIGHTHIPGVFYDAKPFKHSVEAHHKVDPMVKMIVNVGSVGQPRDKDPRASWVLYDAGAQEIEIRRVEYDRDEAKRRFDAYGLPEKLGKRLLMGV